MTRMVESYASHADGAVGSSLWPTRMSRFFDSLERAKESGLFLDFDGTLAPFRIDPSSARPWARVPALLEEIQRAGRSRIVIVSGRPVNEVAKQLGLNRVPEIWGLHGAERLDPNGTLTRDKLLLAEETMLNAAWVALHDAKLTSRFGMRLEKKWNAIALHWRGLSSRKATVAHNETFLLLNDFAKSGDLSLLQFDSGIELRAGRNKGDAVSFLLKELPATAPVAYLGDDATDEDAFIGLGLRGLSVLVRREWRSTAAQLWLRPPTQLREFLTRWAQATS